MRSPETTAASRPETGAATGISTSYKWWVIFMLWFVCFFNYADRQSIFSVFPKFKEEFGFDKVQLGFIGSAFMWVYAAAAPLAGFIGDRVRRKDLILVGCVFWSFITMSTAWCVPIGSWAPVQHFGDFVQWLSHGGELVRASVGALGALVLIRALEGLGETFYFPASMSLASDYHNQRTRSRALAFHQSSVYIGTIAGSWAGAWFAERHGWRVGFYFFGGAGILLAIALYKFLREPARGEAETAGNRQGNEAEAAGGPPSLSHVGGGEAPPSILETLRIMFRSPVVPLLMLAFVGANFVATIFLTWTPTFLVEKFGFRLTAAGLSGSVYIHLASAASVPVAGWLADRFVRRFGGGRMLVQAMGLLAGAAFVFLVGKTASTRTLLMAMACFGVCKGFYDSGIFASLYDAIEPRARSTAAGLMNTVGWTGGALGPVFVGYASKYGSKPTEIENMSDAIAFGGVIYLVAAALIIVALILFSRQRRSASTATR